MTVLAALDPDRREEAEYVLRMLDNPVGPSGFYHLTESEANSLVLYAEDTLHNFAALKRRYDELCAGGIENLKPTDFAAPETLVEPNEGEIVWVRSDLATTATKAAEYALGVGYNVAGWSVDEVEMLPVPSHFKSLIEDFGSWGIVRAGTPWAISYWRFRC